MTIDIVRLDSNGRMDLSRFGVEPGQTFNVSEDADGRIKLTPVPEGWDDGAHDAYLDGSEEN